MKTRFPLPVLAVLFLIFSRLSCEQECESLVDVPSYLTESGLSTSPLDNRKETPVLLPPGAQGFLDAYGFRLTILPEPVDSLRYEFCGKYYLDPGIAALQVFTRNPIPGMSDPDVSDRFRYVYTIDRIPTYLRLAEAPAQIMSDKEDFYQKRYDFLLVEPPATEGWYQFELRITMQDSSILSTVTDSIYLK